MGNGARCRGRPCACEDGLDNDGDGTSDGLDTDCTSPIDDDEAELGIGSLRPNTCMDCFFDANEGTDDGCRYPESCRASGVPSVCGVCDAAPECEASCRPLVPNGCDCFGCCTVEHEGASRDVVLIEGCTADRLDDPERCPSCVMAAWCRNTCERCEWCPGRASLPEDCVPSCADGERPCQSSAECAATDACVMGCCLLRP